jgi:hypothetical protein
MDHDDSEGRMIVYVAGPYRARTVAGIARNIARAREVAERVWKAGHVALCPHLNSAFMDGLLPDGDGAFLRGGIELLKRCDAVILVPRWRDSIGTQEEIRAAGDAGIPVFRSVADLKRGQSK